MKTIDRSADRGSVTLEVAILAPALLLVLGLVVVGGRVQVAASTVEHATAAAARAASLSRTPAAAQAGATETAHRELAAQDLRCTTSTVSADTSRLAAPVGATTTVTVTASCTVSMSDLALPGLPGTRTLTATATSPVDRYRTR